MDEATPDSEAPKKRGGNFSRKPILTDEDWKAEHDKPKEKKRPRKKRAKKRRSSMVAGKNARPLTAAEKHFAKLLVYTKMSPLEALRATYPQAASWNIMVQKQKIGTINRLARFRQHLGRQYRANERYANMTPASFLEKVTKTQIAAFKDGDFKAVSKLLELEGNAYGYFNHTKKIEVSVGPTPEALAAKFHAQIIACTDEAMRQALITKAQELNLPLALPDLGKQVEVVEAEFTEAKE